MAFQSRTHTNRPWNAAAPRVARLLAAGFVLWTNVATAQLAIRGKTIHTMTGTAITDGVIIVRNGKIAEVGSADAIKIPQDMRVLDAAVVTPGLVDAHSTVGLTGIYNQPHDQDQLERSAPIQPELRAIDAYNPQEKLVEWLRGFGITTVHTGHAPGELISGQTAIVKLWGATVDEAVLVPAAAVAATIGAPSQKSEKGKAPGTRGKMMAMLRAEFIKAQEYKAKRDKAADDKKPDRSLAMETLVRVLDRELPLMVTANKAQDISSALRLAKEFNIRLWLDGAAESYLLIEEIKTAGVPVILHPTMQRAFGDYRNMSFETAGKLRIAGIPVAMQSGYESYVPKTRVVLYEAAWAAANGLGREGALAAITVDAARILGIDHRVGTIAVGKDADLALFDGDPFEYTSHCTGTIINGQVVHNQPQ